MKERQKQTKSDILKQAHSGVSIQPYLKLNRVEGGRYQWMGNYQDVLQPTNGHKFSMFPTTVAILIEDAKIGQLASGYIKK